MVRVQLRTKFLLSMVLISAGLTLLSLLVFRHSVQSKIKEEIFSDLRNSVSTFQSFQREQETTLSHSADLLADLPEERTEQILGRMEPEAQQDVVELLEHRPDSRLGPSSRQAAYRAQPAVHVLIADQLPTHPHLAAVEVLQVVQ